MKKFIAGILASIMMVFGVGAMSGCSFLDDALDNAVKIELLEEENKALKEELATLKFELAFPNGIINQDVILNSVNRSVPYGEEGDAIQVIGNSTVTINGGKFDGGQTPLGGAGNTSVWVNSADAKVIINGGEFTICGLAEGDTGHIDLIYVSQGTVEINGGYFYGADDTVWLLNCKDAFYKDGTASIVVKGGTFINFDPSNCVSEGENTNFVAEGYKADPKVIGEDTYYIVVEDVEETIPEVEEQAPETPDEF